MERHQQELIALGKTLAGEGAVLDGLMDELTACSTGMTLGPLAKGLVERRPTDGPVGQTRCFVSLGRSGTAFAGVACLLLLQPPIGRCGAHRRTFDGVPKRPMLTEWFPYFQKRVVISAAGLQRLKDSLTQKSAPADRYRGLGWINKLDDSATLELIPLILELAGGFDVAVETIHMRIVQERQDKRALSPEFITAGRIVIEACEFDRRLNHDTHALEEVIEACLRLGGCHPNGRDAPCSSSRGACQLSSRLHRREAGYLALSSQCSRLSC